MSLEGDIYAALGSLVSNRVYPDVTPDSPVFPLMIYQQVGGEAFEFLEHTIPSKHHARIQVMVWAKTRLEASALARSARTALVTGSLKANTYGAPVSIYDATMKLYGNRTDYGIWFTP